VEGSYADKRKAFEAVMDGLKQKLDAFALLPLEKLDHSGIKNELRKLASI